MTPERKLRAAESQEQLIKLSFAIDDFFNYLYGKPLEGGQMTQQEIDAIKAEVALNVEWMKGLQAKVTTHQNFIVLLARLAWAKTHIDACVNLYGHEWGVL